MRSGAHVVAVDGAAGIVRVTGDVGTDVPAVVVCHGFVQDAGAFAGPGRSWVEHLADQGFTVWEVTLRGRSGQALHSFHDLVTHDVPAVWRAVAARHARVAWLGHSLGGLLGVTGDVPADVDVRAVVTVGAPLVPGPAWLPRIGLEQLLMRTGRVAHARGAAFPGRAWGRALHAARHALDRVHHTAGHHLWAAGSLHADELTHALRSTFANDSWALFADLVELRRTGGMRAGDVDVDARVRSFRAPLLCAWGTHDGLAPPAAARPLFDRVGSADKVAVELHAGHIDLLVGARAERELWPQVDAFLRARLGTSAGTSTQ